MHALGEKYLRKSALPFIFCPGCGDGTILGAMLRVIDKVGLSKFNFVSGIGCSGWIPVFINADVIHALHGRAIPVATGLKNAQPEKNLVVFTGDGDCLGIGGNHFIHAARRNLDITVVMVNNYIYGMTGGQVAPTTPEKVKTKTSPYGNLEPSFDAVSLAIAAGATFVARQSTAYPRQLQTVLEKAVDHKGFSFIEVMTQCPTQAGRNIFGSGEPGFLLEEIKKHSILSKKQELKPGDYYIGILHEDTTRPIYEVPRVGEDRE
ncbi:MAG: thiamine pyrophosphate-dependent enzyme [Desulfitobacteriaceae bacterium]